MSIQSTSNTAINAGGIPRDGFLDSLPGLIFNNRPTWGAEMIQNYQKTRTACLDELYKIKKRKELVEKLRMDHSAYYSRLPPMKREDDFPKIVFLGTSAAVPSLYRNSSGILLHTRYGLSFLNYQVERRMLCDRAFVPFQPRF